MPSIERPLLTSASSSSSLSWKSSIIYSNSFQLHRWIRIQSIVHNKKRRGDNDEDEDDDEVGEILEIRVGGVMGDQKDDALDETIVLFRKVELIINQHHQTNHIHHSNSNSMKNRKRTKMVNHSSSSSSSRKHDVINIDDDDDDMDVSSNSNTRRSSKRLKLTQNNNHNNNSSSSSSSISNYIDVEADDEDVDANLNVECIPFELLNSITGIFVLKIPLFQNYSKTKTIASMKIRLTFTAYHNEPIYEFNLIHQSPAINSSSSSSKKVVSSSSSSFSSSFLSSGDCILRLLHLSISIPHTQLTTQGRLLEHQQQQHQQQQSQHSNSKSSPSRLKAVVDDELEYSTRLLEWNTISDEVTLEKITSRQSGTTLWY